MISSHCPPLKITFLGTGTSSGVPMLACNCEVCTSTDKKDKRLRSSILVQSDTTTIVVDTTPDFRYQMLRENVQKLDAILYTHPHKDHIAGLDDIRGYNYFMQRPMDIYTNALTLEGLKREFHYIFADYKYPGVPDVNIHIIPEELFYIGDIPVLPFYVWHLHMPVLGFRFGKFTYVTDANRIDETEQNKIMGSEILVLNALREEQHISHFTLDEATSMGKKLQVGRTYFTHISHQLGMHGKTTQKLAPGTFLAYDGLVLEI